MKKYTNMKFHSFLVITLSFWLLTACQSTKTQVKGVKKISDIEKMDLNAPIKSMKVKSYRISINTQTGKINYNGPSKTNAKNLFYLFDENGNIIEKTSYDTQDQLQSKWTFNYDDKKKQITEKIYGNAAKEPQSKQINYYNKNGNKTKHLSYTKGEDKDPYKETLIYNKNGKLIEKTDYVNAGPLKITITYDNQGQLMEKTEHMADKLQMKETYKYNDDGNLIASKQDENRTVHAKYVFEKKYKNGKETARKVYKNGAPDGRYMYNYNDHGDRVEFKKYDIENNLVFEEKTKFEYDAQNNWTKKIPFNANGIPKYLIEREIEYHEK